MYAQQFDGSVLTAQTQERVMLFPYPILGFCMDARSNAESLNEIELEIVGYIALMGEINGLPEPKVQANEFIMPVGTGGESIIQNILFPRPVRDVRMRASSTAGKKLWVATWMFPNQLITPSN
jgi:hypothetical protein